MTWIVTGISESARDENTDDSPEFVFPKKADFTHYRQGLLMAGPEFIDAGLKIKTKAVQG